MAVIGGFCVYRRKKYAEVKDPWEKPYAPFRYSYKCLYKATRGFSNECRVGEVYIGTLPRVGDIAVKRLTHDTDAEQGLQQFVAEVVTMGSLQHKTLVPLLGYCRRKGELFLVSKYMEGGSVDQYLFHGDKPPLSWSQRLAILRDIASVLCYLHTGASQVVVHRNIKASNVMLDGNRQGFLGDFWALRFANRGSTFTAPVGSIGYMAPEEISTGTSTRTDVYAFGALMLEVTCGRRPFDPEMPVEKRHLVKWVCECWRKGSLVDAVDTSLRGTNDRNGSETRVALYKHCPGFKTNDRTSNAIHKHSSKIASFLSRYSWNWSTFNDLISNQHHISLFLSPPMFHFSHNHIW